VRADVGAGDSGFLYPSLGGTRDARGVVTYGRTLRGVRVLWIPSAAMNSTARCEGGDENCQNLAYDNGLFMEQARARTRVSQASGCRGWG
jgi:hypothetical protein